MLHAVRALKAASAVRTTDYKCTSDICQLCDSWFAIGHVHR